MARVRAAGPGQTPAPAGPAPRPKAGPEADGQAPLDIAAEPDALGASGLSEQTVRRAALMLVAKRLKDQDRQADIDRIHADFDANAAERAEYLRQMNVLRDMAMEQQKHDDEILKKWISRI